MLSGLLADDAIVRLLGAQGFDREAVAEAVHAARAVAAGGGAAGAG